MSRQIKPLDQQAPEIQNTPIQESETPTRVIEKEVNLSLLNEKLNYVIAVMENINNGLSLIIKQAGFKAE
jgi:hypothetical protein